jgi:zinc transporter
MEGSMTDDDGLLSACLLDGQGGGRGLDWPDVRAWSAAEGPLWVHLDYRHEASRAWLWEEAGLDPAVADSLMAEDPRPRCDVIGEGLLLVLRGVNLNPGADPEDMVSVRVWAEDGRIISTRHRKVAAVADLRDSLIQSRGPRQPGDLIAALAGKLVERMGPVITALDDEVDRIEGEVLASGSRGLRHRLHGIRHQAISLRRYIAPQRDAMTRLIHDELEWFDRSQRTRLREVADHVTRYIEDLDAARERASVVQDELASRLSEEMNRTMYVLSLVATVFLPLGLVTGLLGVNVGGVPGQESPYGFAVLCAVLIAAGAFEVWLFKRLKWV